MKPVTEFDAPQGREHHRLASLADVLKRLWRIPEGRIGIVIFVFLMVLTVAGDLLAPYDPVKVSMKERLDPPSREHWFGTDEVGRDILSRVVVGTRVSLASSAIVIGMAALIGIPLGLIAGFTGGTVDNIAMRLTDMFLGFPALLLAIAVAAALGPGLYKGMAASALVWWPGYARLARGQALAIKQLQFVEAARSIGVPSSRILFRHVLGNTANPFIIKATMDIGYAILFVSGLGFLGLGAQPPTPEWGTMVADGRTYILEAWWYATFPGLAITTAVICFNFLGDALQYGLDPTMTNQRFT